MDGYLLFDADCRLCTLAKGLVKALDWHGRIHPVPIHGREANRLLAGMDEIRRDATFHFVANGHRASGGDALLAVLGALPIFGGVPGLARHVSVLHRASGRVYAVLSDIRHALQCAT